MAAVDEELKTGSEVGSDEGGDALAAGEAGAGVGDEELHHGANVGVEVAGDELLVCDVEALHGVGGNVPAAAGAVFDDVLVEVSELEAGADFIREVEEFFGVVAADEEDESAYGVGGVARVVFKRGERFLVGVNLVLLEGGDEVVEGLDGKTAHRDGGLQGNEDGVARGGGFVKALMEHGAPGCEQTSGGCGVGYFVAEVVRGAAEGVDAVEVGAKCGGKEERRDVEILVMGGGESLAPGPGFGERGTGGGREVDGGGAEEAVVDCGGRGVGEGGHACSSMVACGVRFGAVPGKMAVLISGAMPSAGRVSMARKILGRPSMVQVPVRKSCAWKRPEAMRSKARRAVAGV